MGGLDVIANSGMPVSVTFQELDYHLYPFLEKFQCSEYSNIEWSSAPFAHTLMPRQPAFVQRWLKSRQMRHVDGCVPVGFFSEFAIPDDNHIGPKFFWILES